MSATQRRSGPAAANWRDLIDGPGRGGIADGRRHETARVQTLQPRRPHQPSHAFLADPTVVRIGQLGVDAGRPVRAVRAPVDRVDQDREPDVLHGPS